MPSLKEIPQSTQELSHLALICTEQWLDTNTAACGRKWRRPCVSWNNSKGKQSTGRATLSDVLVHWASLPKDHDKAQRYVLDCLKMQHNAICGQTLLSVYLLVTESAPVSKGQSSGVGDSGGHQCRFSIVQHLMLQPMLFYTKCIKIFIKRVKKLAGMKSHLNLSHRILICCTLKCVGPASMRLDWQVCQPKETLLEKCWLYHCTCNQINKENK